jgi:CheY-like chemotaxis protein
MRNGKSARHRHEEMIRWSNQQTLSAAGHEVTVCETAAEGMALFQWLRPDVVLLDLRLPDANGATILKAIKAENDRETKVIVITAFEEDCTAERAAKRALAVRSAPRDEGDDAQRGVLAGATGAAVVRRATAELRGAPPAGAVADASPVPVCPKMWRVSKRQGSCSPS